MALTAGALSKVLVSQSTASLSSTAASGGTGPYTEQWYRSTVTGFTPGAGTLVPGGTSLSLLDSGLVPGTVYYYVVVYTDVGASTTINSAQLSVAMEPGLLPNQFAQGNIVGIVDMKVGPTNVIAAQVDLSVTSVIYPGQAVKIVPNTAGGTPKVAPITLKSDPAIGFAIFNIKDIQYASPGNPAAFASAGQTLSVALMGTIIWCYATSAVTQFQDVCIDPTYVGGVQPAGNSATRIGWAFDGSAAAGLVRVMILQNSTYATE
jgi:hypothetical protein